MVRAILVTFHLLAFASFVPSDEADELKKLQTAAEQGDPAAQWRLGTRYKDGIGVPQNYVEAHKWYNLAAATGITGAAEDRDKLARQMTPEQIAEAQRRAASFVRSPESTHPPTLAGEPPVPNKGTQPSVSGTGFFITTDGFLITCLHVVEAADAVQVRTRQGALPATIVKTDSSSDMAILKVAGSFPALALADSSSVKLGETVFTIGFPHPAVQGFDPKLTKGEISSLTGIFDAPVFFQISTQVQPGNSGGALVNMDGNAVGVVNASLNAVRALLVDGFVPQNVNYAVKSSYVKAFLESLPQVTAKMPVPTHRSDVFTDLVDIVDAATVLIEVYQADGTQAPRIPRHTAANQPSDGPFIDNGDGTVSDTRTGLMWAARDSGRNINWNDAKRYCESYDWGGYSDWRMPTASELQWLYDDSKDGAKGYHITRFITVSECCIWASDINGSSAAQYVEFDGGDVDTSRRSAARNMRALPVRSTRPTKIPLLTDPPPNEAERARIEAERQKAAAGSDGRFINNRDGTVTDTESGLMWASTDNGRDITWEDAKGYCESYRGRGYTDWRMPTVEELMRLYDKSRSQVAHCDNDHTTPLHLTSLIRVTCYGIWSSETKGASARYVGFNHGSPGICARSDSSRYRVLPVRSLTSK